MNENHENNLKLNDAIHVFFKDALKVVAKNPSMAKFVFQTIRNQQKAAQTRLEWEKEGLQVPPYMVISITNRCNLRCKGCYCQAQHRPVEKELAPDRLRTLIGEASTLGVSVIFLAGGEPLMRSDILEIAGSYPEVIFPLFTNGLLITDETVSRLRELPNVIPVVSMEGKEAQTDERRGAGVYARLRSTLEKMKKAGLFSGLSFTVTKENFATLTDAAYIKSLMSTGSRLFFFVEYIPVKEETEELVITAEQRQTLVAILNDFRAKFSGLFVAFPGDEEEFGGCLSAGRGFIHISAEGDLEPCPFAPYSDTNVREGSLKEALRSDFLHKIRQNPGKLSETRGGCALWEEREWVKSLL